MSRTGPPGPASVLPEAQRRKAAGAWIGSLIFALFLLSLIIFDAQAAYRHRWAHFAGITVFTLACVTIPAGRAKWLRRSLRGNEPPAS